jgi:Carboxypeptidase regulatory-like domain/TonB-dependent Receptor Plug Domain
MTRRIGVPALLAVLWSLAIAAPALAADTGGITGRVTDRSSGHALAFATVALVGVPKGGMTDSEGQFLIAGLAPGTYDVKVQFMGYDPEVRSGVVVTAGKPAVVDFALREVVVSTLPTVNVDAERRLVEARQGATIRSVSATEIRNLPVQTIGEVLQQQAGISSDADQIHVRGGRTDETIFVVNGVTNRDLVTGQSTAGQLSARSVAEVNVATGAYDVRYGNALSGVVEIKLKEGAEKFEGGLTSSAGSYGGRATQLVLSGPDPVWRPLLTRLGLKPAGTVSTVLDVSGSFYATRYGYLGEGGSFLNHLFDRAPHYGLRSTYEDTFFGIPIKYDPKFFSPSQDNRWAARLGWTWKPNRRDKVTVDYSKRLSIDQGFSRTFISATGDQLDPAYPWKWAHRISHSGTIFEDNTTSSLDWRRTLSSTGYTEFQFSRYFYAQREGVQDLKWSQYQPPDDTRQPEPQRSDYFWDTGDDDTWSDRRTTSYDVQWTLVQRLKRHEVEVGFDHQFQTVQYMTIQDPWNYDPNGLGSAHDLWRVHPMVGNLFVRDRLEYEGFTANIGLRADYWFIGREAERVMADTSNANISPTTRNAFFHDTRSFFGRRVKLKFSPRIIVAHPITENSSFFFNYGQFTQIPSYRYVFSKLNSVSSESFPLLGNPNLNPQVSVNYEVGGKHQFAKTAAANLTFFVKDVYDYPTGTTFKRTQGTSLVDVFVYLNGHFARSKGFEIEVEKRRSNNWSSKLAYTFQQTKGKSSDPNEQRVIQQNGGDAAETRLAETFVSWNRPHKLTFSFDVRFDDTTPDVLRWAKRTGLNVYVQGSTGRAYTPQAWQVGSQGVGSLITVGEPNSRNGPFQITTDARLNRWFKLGGRRFDFSLAGMNVFDNRLIYRIDPVTGKGRVWGKGVYDFTKFGSTDRTPKALAYLYSSEIADPSNYGPGAQWRLSLDVDF